MLQRGDKLKIAKVLKGEQLPNSEAREAWGRIKKELVEGQKPTTNTGSPKLPTLEEVMRAVSVHVRRDRRIDGGPAAYLVKDVYDYMCRQLRAGA